MLLRGDFTVMHPDWYLAIRDRSKDVIISGDQNLSSVEVESVLYTHPAINKAAAVARPGHYWGRHALCVCELEGRDQKQGDDADSSMCWKERYWVKQVQLHPWNFECIAKEANFCADLTAKLSSVENLDRASINEMRLKGNLVFQLFTSMFLLEAKQFDILQDFSYKVPHTTFLLTHVCFLFYHVMSSMTLQRLRHSIADLPKKVQWVFEAAWILALAYLIPWLDTIAISNVCDKTQSTRNGDPWDLFRVTIDALDAAMYKGLKYSYSLTLKQANPNSFFSFLFLFCTSTVILMAGDDSSVTNPSPDLLKRSSSSTSDLSTPITAHIITRSGSSSCGSSISGHGSRSSITATNYSQRPFPPSSGRGSFPITYVTYSCSMVEC
ncbi:hypothetical protein FEM48_Zijuj05G0052300 [Ziziphus jujuba var. spinosa]|uniref:Uncharacterized protein n=1 Tax=Ziziphus jujuba var. spinosa TaxID=714518 RepID=A0A978VD08_ZIZJJ|nr:hypothetical protein FEM48_Zijuj05G0052300 [Ziziphus jujuba var. spinosa]